MYKLNFTLKQHTPLIHFLPDQDGATLRATEVKPRLDSFIKGKVNFENDSINLKRYLLGNTNSFDYKLRLFIKDEEKINLKLKLTGPKLKDGKEIYETESFPFMLANMGGKGNKSDLKNFSLYRNVYGVITTEHEFIIHKIMENIDLFFLFNNFGNRKNKGFGSYTLTELQGKRTFRLITDIKPGDIARKDSLDIYKCNKITFDAKDLNSLNNSFKSILLQYQRLKSGKNEAKINEYFKKSQFREKDLLLKKIQNKLVDKINDYKYTRAILGLAEYYEFGKNKVRFDISNDEIKRFATPFDIKIIEKDIYIIPKKIEESEIYNASFRFENENGISEQIDLPLGINENFSSQFLGKYLNEPFWKKITLK